MLRLTVQKWTSVRHRLRHLGKLRACVLGLVTRGQATELQQALWKQTGEVAELRQTLSTQAGEMAELRLALSTQFGRVAEIRHTLSTQAGELRELRQALSTQAGEVALVKSGFEALAQTVSCLDVPDESSTRLAALEEKVGKEEATRTGEFNSLKNSLQALAAATERYSVVEAGVASLVAREKDESCARIAALEESVGTAASALAAEVAALKERCQPLTDTAARFPALEERVGQAERHGQEQTVVLAQLAEQTRSATDLLQTLRDGPVHELRRAAGSRR